MRIKKITLYRVILGLLLLTGSNAYSTSEFNQLCSYDSLCEHLRNLDGSFKQIKPEVVKLVAALKPEIDQAAKDYGVDPRAIAGAIIAENSLNVQISDKIQDLLVNLKITPDAKIPLLNKSMSIGLGQIYPESAEKVEKLSAEIDKRPIRDTKDIATALETPLGSIRYVAAILRDNQDIYKKNGIDLSKDPALADTVYNLGKAEQRAKQTSEIAQKNHALPTPKINYFGYFIKTNLKTIESETNIHANDVVSGDVQKLSGNPAPALSDQAQSKIVVPNKKSTVPNKKKSDVASIATAKLVKENVAIADLILARGPSSCQADGSGNEGEEKRFTTFKSYNSTGLIKAGEGVTHLADGLGCGMEDWVLVRSSSNQTGWIKKSDLDKSTQIKFGPSMVCQQGEVSCSDKISKVKNVQALDDAEAKSTSKNGLTEISLGQKEDTSWKKPENHCMDTEDIKRQNDDFSQKMKSQVQVASGAGIDTNKQVRDFVNDPANKEWAIAAKKRYDDIQKKGLEVINKKRHEAGLPDLTNWRSEENPNYVVSRSACDRIDTVIKICASSTWYCVRPNGDYSKQLDALEKVAENSNFDNPVYYTGDYPDIGSNVVYVGHDMNSPEGLEDIKKAQASLDKCNFIEKDSVAGVTLSSIRKFINEGGLSLFQFPWISAEDVHTPYDLVDRIGDVCEHVLSPQAPLDGVMSERYCPKNNSSMSTRRSVALMKYPIQRLRDDNVISQYTGEIVSVIYKQGKIDLSTLLAASIRDATSSQIKCGYNQFKTIKQIEEILKLNCVKAVYVQDPFLLNYFSEKNTKVLYRAFSAENRYAVETNSGSCH